VAKTVVQIAPLQSCILDCGIKNLVCSSVLHFCILACLLRRVLTVACKISKCAQCPWMCDPRACILASYGALRAVFWEPVTHLAARIVASLAIQVWPS